jgi:UDP-GlcNAc:undecaprenyl-phosphate GlcNAc-1-phosphate transferase
MDFLILFLVAMLIKIPGEQLQEYHLGVIAAKIIIFYFSYEVLIAEQRQKSTRLALATMGTLILFSLKNLFL